MELLVKVGRAKPGVVFTAGYSHPVNTPEVVNTGRLVVNWKIEWSI